MGDNGYFRIIKDNNFGIEAVWQSMCVMIPSHSQGDAGHGALGGDRWWSQRIAMMMMMVALSPLSGGNVVEVRPQNR